MIHDLLVQAYDQYTTYLSSNPPFTLPYRAHVDAPDFIHVSSLGMCPLQTALNRRKVTPKYPDLLAENNLWTRHLMEQGKRDAAPLQEALLSSALFHDVQAEYPVSDPELKLKGRIDVLVRFGDPMTRHIIEIKRRDLPKNGGTFAPKLTDIYQVMGYGLITLYNHMHVVLMNRYNFVTWSVMPQGNGFQVFDSNGTLWDHPLNTPAHLNYDMLRAEVERQRTYLEGRSDACPIPDPLNDDLGYLCVTKTRYANKAPGSKGKVRPNCAHFCFGDDDEIEIVREADGSLSWDVDFVGF